MRYTGLAFSQIPCRTPNLFRNGDVIFVSMSVAVFIALVDTFNIDFGLLRDVKLTTVQNNWYHSDAFTLIDLMVNKFNAAQYLITLDMNNT